MTQSARNVRKHQKQLKLPSGKQINYLLCLNMMVLRIRQACAHLSLTLIGMTPSMLQSSGIVEEVQDGELTELNEISKEEFEVFRDTDKGRLFRQDCQSAKSSELLKLLREFARKSEKT